ncbi:HNH endonuclease [Tenacibaculum retecalamus]|uniref:HNH endonuclease n=1 Tax=Tenacibaculum retecalamus TaxID=3018315 RepID=UPI0023D93F48|nr:hypothetical protein [Tenacibaculum retecalamus]WBX72001.1 hypothetical protein PG912_04315 [Tenacibaculum retecalamus]
MSFLIIACSFFVFFILYLIKKGIIKDGSWSVSDSTQSIVKHTTNIEIRTIKKDIKPSQKELEKLRQMLSNKYSLEYLKNNFKKIIHLYDLSLSCNGILFFRRYISNYDEFEFSESEITKLYSFIKYLNKKEKNILENVVNLSEKRRSLKKEYDLEKWREEKFYELDSYQSVFQLINNKSKSEIKYSDLLKCFEWKLKRFKILFRDKYKCQKCNTVSIHNHVHHKYYLKNKLPWDIRDYALITLCENCHLETHRNEKISTFEESKDGLKEVITHFVICSRCNGTGYLLQYSYNQGGVCFKCKGNFLSKSFFEEALKNVRLKKHNSSGKLEKALSFIESITYEEFITITPDIDKYQFSNVPNKREYYNENDDLPF